MTTARETPVFPSGAYAKYKRATTYFLCWLLRARVVGGVGVVANANTQRKKTKKTKKNSADSAANSLDQYERIVAAIAQEPTILPAHLRRQWPRALAACESAITLRAHVAQFYSPKTGDPHHHFLERLTHWFCQLRDANVGQASDQLPTIFANYYDVLDLPDDFFDDADDEIEATISSAPSSSCSSSSSSSSSSSIRSLLASERKRLSEAPFRDDAALEVAYFLMELDELSESVYSAFHDVKTQKKTLVEATVVTHVAIDFAKRVIARFQLQQPTVRTALDLRDVIMTSTPSETVDEIIRAVQVQWAPSTRRENAPYVRGVALLDVMWVTASLQLFVSCLPPKNRPLQLLDLAEGRFGETYSEERTPQYTIPAFSPPPRFLMQQLRLLYNAALDCRERNIALDDLGFTNVFFRPLVTFFESREVSIELLFVCICWVRSVSALQGNAGLSRTVGLSMLQQWKLQTRLRESIDKQRVQHPDAPFLERLSSTLEGMEFTDEFTWLSRANPLIAGHLQLTHQLRYLSVGIERSKKTTHLRTFVHMYSALRDRKLLSKIPFFENLIALYQIFFFKPSRAAAAHGSFLRVYRSKQSDAPSRARRSRRHKHTKGLCRCLRGISTIVRILKHHNYYRELSAELLTPTASWKTRLDRVSELCSIDLFEFRVLSLDMLKLSNDLDDLFLALHDELGENSEFTALLTSVGTFQRVTPQSTVEDAVATRLLSLLDSLQLDGSSNIAATVGVCTQAPIVSDELGAHVLQYCQRAAAVVLAFFSDGKPTHMERTYFTFPSKPEWFDLEFGGPMDVVSVPTESTKSTFRSLMKVMEESTGPLNDDQLATLKNHVKADPALLSMVVPVPDVELCTLFHHAAAGRARDRALVEWLIQMGAFHRQPKHFHNPLTAGETNASVEHPDLCNYMGVHSAAKAGLNDMVRLILEADLLRDINKVTYHTKESLVHLAVRNDDEMLVDMLDEFGANLCTKDAAGRYAHDLTTNAKWKREMLDIVVWQSNISLATAAMQKEWQKEDISATTSEREQATTLPRASTPTRQKTPKEKTSPPNRAEIEPMEDVILSDAARHLEELRVGKTASTKTPPTLAAEPARDRISQLTQWLDTLKAGDVGSADASDRDAAATAAVHLLDTLRASVQYFALAPNLDLFSTGVVLRDAGDASRALFLLSKFHRQLPSATRDHAADPEYAQNTAWGKLLHRTGPAHDFGDFQAFAFFTARVLRSCGRVSQANELLTMVERRLLKQQTSCGVSTFERNVQAYVAVRTVLGLESAEAASPETQQLFIAISQQKP